MPNSGLSEIYFLVLMMVLVLILSAASGFIFFRQLKREKKSLLTKTGKNKSGEQNEKETLGKDYVQK